MKTQIENKMNTIKKTVVTTLTVLGLALASGAYAQQAPAKAGAGMDDATRAKMIEKMQEKRKANVDKHHAQMHEKLKLSATQEPAWKTFLDVTKMTDRKPMQDRKAMADLSAPARMEMMLSHSQERLNTMQKHLAAMKTFYAVLTPEQQKIFDEAVKSRHGQGEHMRTKHEGHRKMHMMPNKETT